DTHKSDYWNCALLRPRRERPRRRAADERDELAPFHQQFIPCFEAEDSIAGDLLHCGISKEPLSTMGHSVIAAKWRFVRQKRSFTPPSASPQDRSSVMYELAYRDLPESPLSAAGYMPLAGITVHAIAPLAQAMARGPSSRSEPAIREGDAHAVRPLQLLAYTSIPVETRIALCGRGGLPHSPGEHIDRERADGA